MSIITLTECESTNTTLRQMAGAQSLRHGTVLRAITQTHGRGQRGNSWEAEPGMNLTFSIFLEPGALPPSHHFALSQAVAMAMTDFLKAHHIDRHGLICVKWPNDIMVNERKIAGILIENTLDTAGNILSSIVGIGLNVNQTHFTAGAPNATSMALLSGKGYELENLMPQLQEVINRRIENLIEATRQLAVDPCAVEALACEYHSNLWRKEGYHSWLDVETGDIFTARIEKVQHNGALNLIDTGGSVRSYFFKEVVAL